MKLASAIGCLAILDPPSEAASRILDEGCSVTNQSPCPIVVVADDGPFQLDLC
jgi:hypothetical protein